MSSDDTHSKALEHRAKEQIMSFEQMIEFLSQPGTGIDVEHFDEISNKTLRDLYKEIQEHEVILMRHITEKYILRCALSVQILIINPDEGKALEEVERYYPRTQRTVPAYSEGPRWSIKETQRRSESPLEAAQRGLREELGLEVEISDFVPNHMGFYTVADRTRTYPSTVYQGLYSAVTTERFYLLTNKISCDEIHIVKDGPTEVILKPAVVNFLPPPTS